MVLFKITSETSAETDVNSLDSQTLFASVEVWERVCLRMWSLLWMSGTKWSSEAICTRVFADVINWKNFFFSLNRRIWEGWSLVFSHANPEDWLQVPQSLPCIPDGRLWKWCGLQYHWSLVDTCISNHLLIGSVFSASFAPLALGRGGNELVAAQC